MDQPHNVEIEQQVLGTMLSDADVISAISALSPDAFYDPCHRDLFKAMVARSKGGELVSPVTMRAFAQQHPGFDALGGPTYLITLAATAFTGSVMQYVGELTELHHKRRILSIIADAQERLRTEGQGAADISATVQSSLSLLGSQGRSAPVSMLKAAETAIRQAREAQQSGQVPGVLTGIASLDRMLGAMRPADLVILGGRPSMGKTAVALSIALNAARAGTGVAVASLEMTPEALAVRAISEATGGTPRGAMPYVDIARGKFTDAEGPRLAQAAIDVGKLPISILPMHFRDMSAIQAGVAQAAATTLKASGLGLVIVDYLQIVQMAGASRYEKVTEISVALKAMAAQLQVPIIVLAQLNRGVEQRDDKRPMMSDLKESGQLEQDADTIIFCYRDEYYLERDKPDEFDSQEDHDEWSRLMSRARNRLELIVAKQRQGPIGSVTVGFNPAINLVWEGYQSG